MKRRSDSTTAAVYKQLGIDAKDVLNTPQVTPLLRQLSSRKSGKLKSSTRYEVIDYLRASNEPPARKFIFIYDDPNLSRSHRNLLTIEEVCVAAKIDPTDLIGPITRVAHLHGAMLGAVHAAKRHPEVVAASLREAVKPEGIEDRMANLKHMGYLPSPKGSTINIGINASATANAAAKSDAAALPSAEDTIRRIVEARQRAAIPAREVPSLTSGSPESVPLMMPQATREPITVDAEYDDD